MTSSSDSLHQNLSSEPTYIKELLNPFILKLQKNFRLYPHKICLISGAPRSGTSALGEWLGRQPGISSFPESRILVSSHRFIEEIHRFKSLNENSVRIEEMISSLIFNYYATSRRLIGKRLILDKEPLEPIAFPLKDYDQFILNIKKIFPNIKLLLTIRDPKTTIWSMSQRKWGESLSNKEEICFSIDEYIENWCACADLILKYSSEPNTYIVQFERLISDPENESRRILNFLRIRFERPFQPRQTKNVDFSKEILKKIKKMTQSRLDSLRSQGITYLS